MEHQSLPVNQMASGLILCRCVEVCSIKLLLLQLRFKLRFNAAHHANFLFLFFCSFLFSSKCAVTNAKVSTFNLTDRCEGVSCKPWEKCVYDSTNGARCVCRGNLDCPADFQPVCGSDANRYNNYCIMKATACRQGEEVEKVADGSCTPGMHVC